MGNDRLPDGQGAQGFLHGRCHAAPYQEKFAPKPGEKFRWTNAALADGKVVGSGTLTADQYGLLTIPKAVVSNGNNRMLIHNYTQ